MTMMDEARIKRIVAENLALTEDEITPEATIEELDGDSLDMIHIVIDTEDEFNIEIPDDRLGGVHTVGDLMRLVSDLRMA
jgi:acyl carrier protein